LESELFGYEEGAFTSAKKEGHIGKFELANFGTLFLDEIGELPFSMQAKLLRAIDKGEIWKLGAKKAIKVNVRIITATNRDLKKEVERGTFRKDLYFRLNVLNIKMPPLRKRKEDIPILANYFLKKESVSQQKIVKEISKTSMDRLIAYDWPGNVRELENTIARAVALLNEKETIIEDIEIDKRDEKNKGTNSILTQTVEQEQYPTIETILERMIENNEIKSLKEVREFINRTIIAGTLKKTKGNITDAASLLKMSRTNLHLLLSRYNIILHKII
jgi:transcriptional regulator with PAS, ATPase and Fis domain